MVDVRVLARVVPLPSEESPVRGVVVGGGARQRLGLAHAAPRRIRPCSVLVRLPGARVVRGEIGGGSHGTAAGRAADALVHPAKWGRGQLPALPAPASPTFGPDPGPRPQLLAFSSPGARRPAFTGSSVPYPNGCRVNPPPPPDPFPSLPTARIPPAQAPLAPSSAAWARPRNGLAPPAPLPPLRDRSVPARIPAPARGR